MTNFDPSRMTREERLSAGYIVNQHGDIVGRVRSDPAWEAEMDRIQLEMTDQDWSLAATLFAVERHGSVSVRVDREDIPPLFIRMAHRLRDQSCRETLRALLEKPHTTRTSRHIDRHDADGIVAAMRAGRRLVIWHGSVGQQREWLRWMQYETAERGLSTRTLQAASIVECPEGGTIHLVRSQTARESTMGREYDAAIGQVPECVAHWVRGER